MKTTIKLILVLTLFCGSAFAEGDMGNGGLWEDEPVVASTGDMGNGGKTCPNGQTTCLTGTSDEKFSIWKFFEELFG